MSILFVIDEGSLLAGLQDFSSRFGQLRHAGVHTLVGIQCLSQIPNDWLGNVDGVMMFRSPTLQDRQVLRNMASLTVQQLDHISSLETGSCICYLSQSRVLVAGRIPILQRDKNRNSMSVGSMTEEFLSKLTWTPLQSEGLKAESSSNSLGLSAQVRAFLWDVLNQEHEFSPLMQRFQRTGIRSASLQGSIIKKLTGDGYIKIFSLAIGKGRPIKLCEPTAKCFEEFQIEWKKTRGALPARAATEFLRRKISKFDDWQCIREGRLREGKQVDLLCHDPQGQVVAIEIANSPGHEVHNAVYCLQFDEVRSHYVVATRKDVLESVKRSFSEIPKLTSDSRVELLLLSQALSDKWMP